MIRTFHRQGRCSRGGHLCNEHSHWGETWCANVHVRASKMEDRKSGAQTRCHFSHLTLILRLEIDIQESSCLEWIHVISNLTGSVLYCCWAACEIWRKMRERTWYDALTYTASKQRMRERTLRCANERFLVPTNEHRLLASQRYHLQINIEICFGARTALD